MRSIGLDIHPEFCEVAVAEQGVVRPAGRIATAEAELRRFAATLGPDDQVALEATGGAHRIAELLRPQAGRVVVANTRELRSISDQKTVTDRRSAATLAKLLEAGMLKPVWVADERTRALRRRIARRAQLVRQRTRAKNEIHAVLQRNLKRAPVSDLFGRAGRRWLRALELPADERDTVDGCLRQIDQLGEEIALVERALATAALERAEVRRLMTIPGVSLISAATLIAVVGDIARFPSARRLVSYLGLDPKVRQSGSAPARHGRISKEGAAAARQVLCEAAHAALRTPGPLRAFGRRVRARRGHNIAIVAVARKLAALAWTLLTRDEDYAYARPSLTRKKLRQAELLAGAPRRRGVPASPRTGEQRERELQAQAERAYTRLVADWQATRPRAGAGAATGARISRPSTGQAARQGSAPHPAL